MSIISKVVIAGRKKILLKKKNIIRWCHVNHSLAQILREIRILWLF